MVEKKEKTINDWFSLFPHISEEDIAEIVLGLADVPIRDFVDIFIERALDGNSPREVSLPESEI